MAPPPPPPPPGAPLPPYVGEAPKRRRSGRVIALAVGIVAVLGASAFAVSSLGGSSNGGASSPEGAVKKMFEAIGNEDVIGILEALPTGERRAIQEPVVQISDELKRLGLASDTLDLKKVPGVDFQVKGLTVESTALGDGVASVKVTGGTITTTTTPKDLPLGQTLKEFGDQTGTDTDVKAQNDTADLADAHIELVAIKDGGSWHVSLFYTLAELARKDAGLDKPNFGHGVTPKGSGSPEGALKNLFEDSAALDFEAMIADLPPDEMRALQDYAPLFLDQAKQLQEQFQSDGWNIKVDDVGVKTSGSGDVRLAQINTFHIEGDSPDGPFDINYDGKCLAAQLPQGSGLTLPGSDGSSSDGNKLCSSDLADKTSTRLADLVHKFSSNAGFVVTQVDGKWYVSPVRSFFQIFIAALKALDKSDIDHFSDLVSQVFGGLDSGSSSSSGSGTSALPPECVGILDDPNVTPDPNDPAVQACYDALNGGSGPTTTAGSGDSTTTTSGDTTTTTLGDDTSTSTTVAAGDLQPPASPDGLGTDPKLNDEANKCYQGDMEACDTLYFDSDPGSSYEAYGTSCGGRLPDKTDDTFCVDDVGATAPPPG